MLDIYVLIATILHLSYDTMRVIILFTLMSLFPTTESEILTIDNTRYPYINVMKNVSPVIWHEKAIAFKMSMSHAVRINSRGIRFLPIGMTSLSFHDEKKIVDILSFFRDNQTQQWKSFQCIAAHDALCHVQLGESFHMRIFPNTGETVYVTHGNELPEKVRLVSHTCPETNSHRTSFHSFDGIFKSDVSLCNVVGGGKYRNSLVKSPPF
jgi:hypothetical protein